MGLSSIATLIVGLQTGNRAISETARRADEWFAFGMSLCGTSLVTFLGLFGVAGLASLASGSAPWVCILMGLFTASGTTAAAILTLWKRSTLTRGIPILAPMVIEKRALEESFAMTETTKGGK